MESPAKNDTSPPPKPSFLRRRRRCLISVAAAAIAIVLVAVILSQTIFKAKRPITTVTSVSLKDLDASLLNGVAVNVTVDVKLSVKNPNRVGFRYGDSTAVLNYRGEQVGEAAIPAGEISAGETEEINVTLTILADRLLSRPEVYADVFGGDLPLSSHTRMAGKVTILGIKVGVVTTTFCEFNVDVSKRAVSDQRCTYKTKL